MINLKRSLYHSLLDLQEVTLTFPISQKHMYAQWLSQTYYFVCHSTRLLAVASSLFKMDKNDFHYRFAEHIKEERHHELLAIKDLKEIGCDIEQFEELPETAAFYQTQYYWIERVNPIALYGYILCLEGFATQGAVAFYESVCATYGKKAGTFLKVHTCEDVDHLEKALSRLESISLEEAHIIEKNLKLSCTLYKNIYLKMLNQPDKLHSSDAILKVIN
jgi:hypothetical protein